MIPSRLRTSFFSVKNDEVYESMIPNSFSTARCIVPWPKEDGDDATDRLQVATIDATPSLYFDDVNNSRTTGRSNTLCRFHPRCLMCCGKF